MSVSLSFAAPADSATIRKVANNFLFLQGYRDTDALVDITETLPFREFRIFSSPEGGFVIVSADNCVVPILGYSTTSPFVTQGMPSNVYGWLEDLERGIRHCRENDCDNYEKEWTLLLNGEQQTPPSNAAVAPLLSTTWDQSPYYNNQCPYDYTYGERTVTGCVATATAQIMKYWAFPSSGYGSNSYYTSSYGTLSASFNTTYSWSSMPTALSSSSTTTQINAVAKLMYHIGVAVEMDYGVSSQGGSSAFNYNYSGSIIASAQTALMRYFKYKPSLAAVFKADYTTTEWNNILKAELNASRPILYSGRDNSGGHSFVCDGYNSSGKFHFNWGWGGYCDGYYTMGSLNPSTGGTGGNSSYTFNLNNAAVIGIEPNNSWSSTGYTYVTASVSGGNSSCTVSGTGSFSYGTTVSLTANAGSGCSFVKWSDGCTFNPRRFIANGGTHNFTAVFTGSGGGGTTDCNPISTPYSENFNSTAAVDFDSDGGSLPTCWDGYSNGTDNAYFPHVTSSTSSYHYSPDNSKSITMTSGSSTYGSTKIVVLPEFTTAVKNLSVSFNYQMESTTYGTLTVGYVTGDNFSSTFHALQTISTSSTMTQTTVSLSGATTTAKRIAFKWYNTNLYYSVGIDNVSVSSSSSGCSPKTVPYSENFNSTAAVDFDSDGGSLPTCWDGYSNGTDNAYFPHVTSSTSSYHYSPDNSKSITMTSGSSTYGSTKIVVLPEFTTAVKNLSVSFNYQMESTTYGTLTVGYVTGDNFSSTFHALQTISTSSTMTQTTVSLSGATTTAKRIAFKWYNTNLYYSVGIDNVSVSSSSSSNYTITVVPNYSYMGRVEGGGTYSYGATAILRAYPNTGYRFVRWSDYSYENPHYVTVTANKTFTAYFEAVTAVDDVNADAHSIKVFPNPASDEATVEISSVNGTVKVMLVDIVGRTVIERDIESVDTCRLTLDVRNLSRGTYFIRIATSSGNSVHKLVLE